MISEEVRNKIEKELEGVKTARQQGQEGRARVCARRAAGLAITPFLEKLGGTIPSSAYDCIVLFSAQPEITPRMRQIASHLLMRVDESYQLPPEINLAAEVHQLIKELEDYSSSSAKIPGKQGRQLIDNQTRTSILFYGTSWCGDCRRARRFFDERNIPYTWIDIDADREARKFVEETNNGFRSVPTIVFPDSSILVEPSTAELEKKLVG